MDEKQLEKARERINQVMERARENLSKIKARIMVMSGKGGVGKTFIATSLALYLGRKGFRVGLYDADETGAADPYVLGERKAIVYRDSDTGELLPIVTRHGLKLMSIEPLLPDDSTPLVWMGPLRTRFLLETMAYTRWGDIDFLVIDLPPGTGDEAITLAQIVPEPRFSLIVSSPGTLSMAVVRKAIVFCNKMGIPILGLVENMAYYNCPGGIKLEVLGKSTAEQLSIEYDIPVLGKIPLDPNVRMSHDRGEPIYVLAPGSDVDTQLDALAERIVKNLRARGVL